MIQRLFGYLRGKRDPAPVKEEEVKADPESVYTQLEIALGRIGTTELHLSKSPASLGRIENFSENLPDFIKSLLEVNDHIKEKKHIEQGLFFVRNVKSVRFDNFLFVHEGYYVDDAAVKIQRAVELIDAYHEYMKNADKELYGSMEYNHRQLYKYTQTLTEFLDALLLHFGE
uniref:Uncharacterized protein n=1 Tax=Burkholderia phage vB_BgluM-SURPRISE13 TaxID=3159457 RepID=A0AAU7PFL4_9VIRU